MYKPTQQILLQDTITEQEIINIRKRMHNYILLADKNPDKGKTANDYEWQEEQNITPEQTTKGLNWLLNKAFKPSRLNELYTTYSETEGNMDWEPYLRKSSPFGRRELHILLRFDHFTFTGLYDSSNVYQSEMGYRFYLPIYKVYDDKGDSFEYTTQMGGEPYMIG